jgi:branched-chain amino acid transport system ATP-binding protein
LLELKNVTVAYGVIEVIHGVSLSVQEGEIITILGPNGAGKTTLLLTISGFLRPRSGTIRFESKDLLVKPPDEIVKYGISHVPEGRRIFSKLTVEENLMVGGYTRNSTEDLNRDRGRMFDLFPILADRKDQLGGTLSGGEQQMLAIARGLMSQPRLMILDEPSLGLAPKAEELIFDVIRKINQAGTTILLVEQDAAMALQTAHRGYVMETGKVILEDRADRLIHNEMVRKAYSQSLSWRIG